MECCGHVRIHTQCERCGCSNEFSYNRQYMSVSIRMCACPQGYECVCTDKRIVCECPTMSSNTLLFHVFEIQGHTEDSDCWMLLNVAFTYLTSKQLPSTVMISFWPNVLIWKPQNLILMELMFNIPFGGTKGHVGDVLPNQSLTLVLKKLKRKITKQDLQQKTSRYENTK